MLKDSLIVNLMEGAARQQGSHLHDYQTSAIIEIVQEKSPALLTSPAAIGLLAHTTGALEFAWGGQRKVEVLPEEFPGEVLYFISNSNWHTIYEHPEIGLAYERLFAYTQLAYLGYKDYTYPQVKPDRIDHLTEEAAVILNDRGLTNRNGQLSSPLRKFISPSMREIFHNRYIGGRVKASETEVKKAVLRDVSTTYKFSKE